MMTEQYSAGYGMNGAAIVLSDGREIPITHTMVQNTLHAMAGELQAEHDSGTRQGWEPMPLQAQG